MGRGETYVLGGCLAPSERAARAKSLCSLVPQDIDPSCHASLAEGKRKETQESCFHLASLFHPDVRKCLAAEETSLISSLAKSLYWMAGEQEERRFSSF